jgi:hypothetical protein
MENIAAGHLLELSNRCCWGSSRLWLRRRGWQPSGRKSTRGVVNWESINAYLILDELNRSGKSHDGLDKHDSDGRELHGGWLLLN